MATTKIIKNIDPRIWGLFTGLCKMQGKIVGEEMNKVLEAYVSKETKTVGRKK